MSFYKRLLIIFTIFALAGSFANVGTVYAHGGNHTSSPSATSCYLRAGVSSGAARQLTGKSGIPHGSGQHLGLNSRSTGGDHGIICLYGLVLWLSNLFFFVLLAVATLVIAYAAFLFVAAGTSQERVGKARKYLSLSIVALIVAIVARAIPSIVRGIIGL